MTDRTFGRAMYDNGNTAWSYAFAFGYLSEQVSLFLRGITTSAQMSKALATVEQHKRAYDALRADGVTPTAALEHLAFETLHPPVGSDSPAGRHSSPPR